MVERGAGPGRRRGDRGRAHRLPRRPRGRGHHRGARPHGEHRRAGRRGRRSTTALDEFLESVALVSDSDELDAAGTPGVAHDPAHRQGPRVPRRVPGRARGRRLPPPRAPSRTRSQLEEERRLCYVGITRARRQLYLTHAWSRTLWGSTSHAIPSRFLSELPERAGARRGLVVDEAPRPAARPVVVAPAPRAGPAAAAATTGRGSTTSGDTDTTHGPRRPRWAAGLPRPRSVGGRRARRGAAPAPPARRAGAASADPGGRGAPGARAGCPRWPSGATARRRRTVTRHARRRRSPTPRAPPGLGRRHLRPHRRPHDPLGSGACSTASSCAGDETVLDAGAGSGRVTEMLLDARCPTGRVVALDAAPSMLAEARPATGALRPPGCGSWRATSSTSRPHDLGDDAPVDAVLSTATFHWVLDHDRLFANLAAVMRPGARPRRPVRGGREHRRPHRGGAVDGTERAGAWLYATPEDDPGPAASGPVSTTSRCGRIPSPPAWPRARSSRPISRRCASAPTWWG